MSKEKQLIRWEKHYSDGSVEYTDLESTKNFVDNLSSVNGLIASRSYVKMKPVEWLKTEAKNLPIANVIWRNWILPFIITLAVSVLLTIVFMFIPENIVTTRFLVGWISCIAFYEAEKHYAI